MTWIAKVALFPLLVLLAACAATPNLSSQEPSSIVSSDSRTIYYRGPIEARPVSEFVALLDRLPRPVVITSAGGDEFASMEMAEAILRHAVPIRIEGYCLSGCANAILIAARTRTLAPDSLIGLHGSAVASLARYRDIGRAPPPRMEDLVQRYERLYAARGASLSLLTCAADQIGMSHTLYSPPGNSDPAKEGWYSKYSLWLPSTDQLSKFGVALVNERSPTYTAQDSAQVLLRAGMQPQVWSRMRWEDEARLCP